MNKCSRKWLHQHKQSKARTYRQYDSIFFFVILSGALTTRTNTHTHKNKHSNEAHTGTLEEWRGSHTHKSTNTTTQKPSLYTDRLTEPRPPRKRSRRPPPPASRPPQQQQRGGEGGREGGREGGKEGVAAGFDVDYDGCGEEEGGV